MTHPATKPSVASKSRGILFSSAMIKALRAGLKTQTRRLVTDQGRCLDLNDPDDREKCRLWGEEKYGAPGDTLWVREAWRASSGWDKTPGGEIFADAEIKYEADGFVRAGVGDGCWGRYRHARFMPRKLARIFLEVTSIRIEQLQDISEEDAIAEGFDGRYIKRGPNGQLIRCSEHGGYTPIEQFQGVWEVLNGKSHPWSSNPFVWVIGFRRLSSPAGTKGEA